jgi:hypothetical protein
MGKYYAGGDSNVAKEAAMKKKGGKVMKAEGKGGMAHLGKPCRASGGRVGADKSPLSSAHSVAKPNKSG